MKRIVKHGYAEDFLRKNGWSEEDIKNHNLMCEASIAAIQLGCLGDLYKEVISSLKKKKIKKLNKQRP